MAERRNMSVVSRVIAGGLAKQQEITQNTPLPSSEKTQQSTETQKPASNFVQTKSGLGQRMRELDPSECRLWKYADRPENEALHAQDLANEFLSGIGQIHPATVREIPTSDPDYPRIKYEIIAGSVRWRASKIAQKTLKAVVRELTDKEAITLMLSENEARKNISEFSRAKQIGLVWESGIYESKGEAADAHRFPAGKFSQYLKVYDHLETLKTMFGDKVADMGLRNLYEAVKAIEDGDVELPSDNIPIEKPPQTVSDLRVSRGKEQETNHDILSVKRSKQKTSYFVQTKLTDEQAAKVEHAIMQALADLGITE